MTIGWTKNAGVLFAVCFLALMTTSGGAAVFACIQKHLEKKSLPVEILPDVPVLKTLAERYPFPEPAGEGGFESPVVQKKPGVFSRYSHLCHHWKYAIEGYSSRLNPLVRPFSRLATALDSTTGSSVIKNGDSFIIRLPNGHLTYAFSGTGSPESWKNMQNFSAWLTERNIPFLQILPATKVADSITEFPPVVPQGYFRMMEQYKSFLSEHHIPYIDAKEVLLSENGDFYFWFYKTDHHWNVYAGRLMAEATVRRLYELFGIEADADAVKKENFTLSRYPSIFYGSMSVKAEAPPEDFEILYPRQEGCFHLEIPSRGIDRTGGFHTTLIASAYLRTPNAYCSFLYGDQPLIQVENRNCTNATRVLVIKHSQADVLCPYLACAIRYLDVIDPRYFDGSLRTFIEKTNPDVVLTCI